MRPLSKRELQIVDGIAAALPNKAIAHHLGITERTVKNVLSRSIFRKLGVRSRAELLLHVVGRNA